MPNFPVCNMDPISDTLDGLLNGYELAELHRHPGKCASCSNSFVELRQVSSRNQGSTLRVSMGSFQANRPSDKKPVLRRPLMQRAGLASTPDGAQVLLIRAYRVDGKPAHAEIKATPMLPTRDSKLNTTA